MTDKKPTDNEIIKALERLKNTKDYLKEQYQEQVKKCPYPELKPIAKQTYEDNKKAFDIAIKAIEEFNRQKAEIERLKRYDEERDIRLHARLTATAKAEAYKECLTKANEIIAEFYNKHIFGNNDLEAEEKDAIINFSDDITYRLNNLLEGKINAPCT